MPGVGFAFHLCAVRPLATPSVAHPLELIRQAWPEGPIRDVDSRDALSCRRRCAHVMRAMAVKRR